MQYLRHYLSRIPKFLRSTLYASSTLLLSACGAGDGGTEFDQGPPVAGAANLAPMITDTSYNCDPILESASFDVGETDQFTLSVSDESPQTLTYSVDSSSLDTVNVTVNESGVFTITALQPGESYLWLGAEDENGLVDEYELKVTVN